MRPLAGLLGFAAALSLAACQTTGDDDPAPSPGGATATAAVAADVSPRELHRIRQQIGAGCVFTVSAGSYERSRQTLDDIDIVSVWRGENDVDQVTVNFRGSSFAVYFFRYTLVACNRDSLESAGLAFVPKRSD